jgi:DNA-binding NarL/FixJ family response regulator
MKGHSIIAAGTPVSFREEVARAIAVEPGEIGWLQSMPAIEEYLMSAHAPVDLIVLSPEVHEANAVPMVEFVARASPHTSIILVRDHVSDGLLAVATKVGFREVVDSTQGTDALRDAIHRVMGGSIPSGLGRPMPNGNGAQASRMSPRSVDVDTSTRKQSKRARPDRGLWWRRIRIAAAVVAALVGYLYFYVVAPGGLDVRYCEQFLGVMQETHDLTTAPTAEQAQQFKTAVEELARINGDIVTFQGASAAAALLRDTNAMAGSPTPENVLAVSHDVDALASACRSDTA